MAGNVFNALIKSFIVVLFCLGIGGTLVFLGFQSVKIVIERGESDRIVGDLERTHFFGAFKTRARIQGLEGARMGNAAPAPGGGAAEETGDAVLYSGFCRRRASRILKRPWTSGTLSDGWGFPF
ncbi:MAG: hypothetical protein ACYTHM_25610 [Planctomycetota bacterium]|jgi:hypothetical protein